MRGRCFIYWFMARASGGRHDRRDMRYGFAVLACIALLLAGGCNKAGPGKTGTLPVREVKSAVTSAQLEQKITRLELRLVEKDAQIEELQSRLDDARREVVRGMAKVQSLATRAEAASGIAEAEITLRSLRVAGATQDVPEVSQLMRLSTAEFDKQNYGGALYLANQAKSAAVAARGQLGSVEQGALRPGEVPFALPIRLQTSARANVRVGPGNGFAIAFTLPSGAALTGHSATDQWVRVTDETGRAGWVYQGLIGRRP
jgi:uncharacterized coiled-coil protein SlyX